VPQPQAKSCVCCHPDLIPDSHAYTPLAVPVERIHLDEEELASHFEENSHDCIMSCLSMHWINDLPGESALWVLAPLAGLKLARQQGRSCRSSGRCDQTASSSGRCSAVTPSLSCGPSPSISRTLPTI